MLEERAHQTASIASVKASIRRQLRAGHEASVILESPTGSGKTAMAALMVLSGQRKGSKVAFIVHRKELVDQTAMTFKKAGIEFSYIASGYPNHPATVRICSVGTLAKRLGDYGKPDVVFWDECHHNGAKTWQDIRQAWRGAAHIGLTATPARLDGKGLGRWFRELVPGPSVAELIRAGQLNRFDAYAPTIPNLKAVHMRAGDFVRSELEGVLDRGEIMGSVVQHYLKLAAGRKAIGFAVSRDHSKHMVEVFNAAGVKAAHLDALTPRAERTRMLQQFALGHFDVIWNVDLFGEGFDLAANSGMDTRVEAVILARPTASLTMHLQQCGRALRPGPEPAIILDHAGNLLRHGLPDEPRVWSLADGAIGDQ